MMPACALSHNMSACAYLHAFNIWRGSASWLGLFAHVFGVPFKEING